MSKLYPIKVLLDANKKPFIPFITSTSIVVDGTEYTVQDMFDMRYTKEEVDAIIQSLGTLQRLRGRVDTYEDLLLIEDQQAGDTYIVGTSDTENSEYMWIGEKWEKLGPLVDLTDYYNKTDIDALLASAEANTAGAIAQGDNETLNLAKNYAEDKIAEAMSNMSLDGALVYKGHVNDVDALPNLGQPSGASIGSYQLSLGSLYDKLITPTTSYHTIRNAITTYKSYFVALENQYTDSGSDGYMGVGVVTDYPEQVTIHFERTGSNYYTPVLHVNYDENKPVYYVYHTRTSQGPYYKLDSATDKVKITENYALSDYILITESMLLGLSSSTYHTSNTNTATHKVSIETNFTKLYMDTSNGYLFTSSVYETVISPNNYYWNSGMILLTCPTTDYNDVIYQTNTTEASENDVYTVGTNYEIYRCNNRPAWEHWSQCSGGSSTSTGPIIVSLLLTSSSPMVTQSGTIVTFLNEEVAPVLKAVGPENVIVMINSTGMITEQYHGMFMYNADLTQLRKIDRTEQVSVRADESGSYTNSISVVSYISIGYTDVDNYVVSSVSFSTADDAYSKISFLDPTKTYSTPFIPTDPGHPVSKQYVDDLILGAEAALDEIIEGGIT